MLHLYKPISLCQWPLTLCNVNLYTATNGMWVVYRFHTLNFQALGKNLFFLSIFACYGGKRVLCAAFSCIINSQSTLTSKLIVSSCPDSPGEIAYSCTPVSWIMAWNTLSRSSFSRGCRKGCTMKGPGKNEGQ